MPAPTYEQQIELNQLYLLTHRGSASFASWKAQIERQGQWTQDSIAAVIDYLRVRSVQNPTGWVDGHHLIDGTVFHVHPPRNARRAAMYPEAREVHSLDLERRTSTGRASWRFRARATAARDQEARGRAYRIPTFTIQTLMTPETITGYAAMHGFCGICGRTLTVAESVERGVGPVCWRRVCEYRDRIAAVTAAVTGAIERNAAASVNASESLNAWSARMVEGTAGQPHDDAVPF